MTPVGLDESEVQALIDASLGSSPSYLLDVLPNATFAGGTIRLSSSATTVAKAGSTEYSLDDDLIDAGSDGAAISEVLDQGGTTAKLTQSTTAYKPAIDADANGVYGLRIGAASATSILDSSFSSISQPCTIYILSSATNANVGRLIASPSTANYALLKNGSEWQLYNSAGLKATAYGGMIGVEKMALVLNGSSSRLHIGNNVQTFDASTISFDGGLRIGAASNTAQPYDGFVYAVAVYPAAHSRTQVATAFDALDYPVSLGPLLLVDGDSIAYGTGLSTAEGQIEAILAAKFLRDGYTVETFNDGSPGQQLSANTEYPSTILARCVSTRKCIVLLHQGTNDLSNSVSAADINDDLVAYWTNVKTTGATLIAETIIARGGGAAHTTPQQEQRLLLNTLIMSATQPDVINDWAYLPEFSTQAATANAPYADAVHPSDSGNVIRANRIYYQTKAAAGL